MQHSNPRSRNQTGRRLAVVLVAFFALPLRVSAQMADRWASTDDVYDAAMIASHLADMRAALAERHGALAQAIYAMNDELVMTPHEFAQRPAGPYVAPIKYRVEAGHLIRYRRTREGRWVDSRARWTTRSAWRGSHIRCSHRADASSVSGDMPDCSPRFASS